MLTEYKSIIKHDDLICVSLFTSFNFELKAGLQTKKDTFKQEPMFN